MRRVRALSLLLAVTMAVTVFLPGVRVKADDKVAVSQQDEDINVIPDKYNTGASGDLKVFNGDTDQWGKAIIVGKKNGADVNLALKESVDKKTGEVSFNMNFKSLAELKALEGEVVLENIDFSGFKIDAKSDSAHQNDLTIVFRNCRFANVVKAFEDSKVTFKFENCNLIRFEGSNAAFKRCALGGSINDPMHIFRNVTVEDTYFSDINFGSTNGTHIDAVQIFGQKGMDIGHIHFRNCRFEVPSIEFEGSTAYVNACIMLQIEYSNGSDIHFEDCILNGGGSTIYAVTDDDFSMTDVSFKDLKIGSAHAFNAIYPIIDPNAHFENITSTDSLYIGTVSKEGGKTSFSVTNDTPFDRKLLIVTDKGDFSFDIPAGPTKKTLKDRTFKAFTDLPADLKKVINADVGYAVCLDVTDPKDITQIRFVNYTGSTVMIDSSYYGDPQDGIRMSGQCGDNASFTLDYNGVLTVTGQGPMWNYSYNEQVSWNPPAWYDMADYVEKIVVKQGVTTVGAGAFKDCFACESIILEDSVSLICGNAFRNCSSLRNIAMPESCKVENMAFEGVGTHTVNGQMPEEPTKAPTGKPVTTTPVTPSSTSTTTPAPGAGATAADPKTQIREFVKRNYSYILGRDAESDGLEWWTEELYSFRQTGSQVPLGFIDSKEFKDRNTSNDQFVTILYKAFFGRDPEPDGFNYWVGQLASGSMTRLQVATGFVYSQEWADTCAEYGIRSGGQIKSSKTIAPTSLTYSFVERMYTTALGRTYDSDGREHWASKLANFDMTGEEVGVFFFLSDEMNGLKLSNEDYVTRLYKTFMNRDPEPEGFNYWVGRLNSGDSRRSVVLGFTRSQEFIDKCIEARILPY